MVIFPQLPDNSIACEKLIDEISVFSLKNRRNLGIYADDQVIEALPSCFIYFTPNGITKAGIWSTRRLNA